MDMKNNIRKWRHFRAKTQSQLAHDLTTSEAMIRRWEKGENLPSVENAIRLAKALDCRVEDLFELEEDIKKRPGV